MSAAPRLRARLNATGAYRLTGETSADWETNACAAGIDALDGEIDALLADLSPRTASEERLAAWEAHLRPDAAQVDADLRREMLAGRLGVHPDVFRLAAYAPLLPGYGARGCVEESDGALQVVVGRELGLSRSEITRELEQLMPAHLTWSVLWPETLNWAVLDAWPRTFEEWDALALPWDELDALTPEDLQPPTETESQEE